MENQKIRCPQCSGTQTYYRTKNEEYHCQSCGNDFKEEDVE